ncbi:MAG TPA: D-aminoacyl-tRNA deacylase [Myxococcota bacterium]|nr:D-aminoacyl-tRNA deacylase [Myxococcota bacterium]
MRAVVQRVRSAQVSVEGEVVCEMGAGLLALVGVGRSDDAQSAAALAERIVQLRIFGDESGRMNRSLLDCRGTLGVVSQFTLFGDARHGRRPSFVAASPADQAAPLIEVLVEAARSLGVRVVTGRFQAAMEVSLVNSGPVTILLDTQKLF